MSSQASKKPETTTEVTPIKEMRGHTDRVQGVVHLHGGRRIITCSSDGSLRLWDLESHAQIGEDWKDELDKTGVNCIALSPNGKTVVSGSDDGNVRLWDVETGKVVAKWGQTSTAKWKHTDRATSVCWSADGDRVVSGSTDGTARVWNVKGGQPILEISCRTGHEHVWAVKYSPDNTLLATGGYYKSVANIFHLETGKLIELEHDHFVRSLAWTSDGKKLITASKGPIRIFDTTNWCQTATLDGHTDWVNAISLSHNDRLLTSASDDKTARTWNLDTNLSVGPPLQHKDELYSAAFSANGRVLVTGCLDKNAYAWDIHAILKQVGLEELLPTVTDIKQETTADVTPIKEMRGHTNEVRGVVHLPGGRRIITCSSDGSLRLWDLESGTQIGKDWRDEARPTAVNSIALSPNGKTVASGSDDGKVSLWDVKTRKVTQRWTEHAGGVTSVCWSAHGNRVVSGSLDGTAGVWDVKTRKPILKIETDDTYVWAVKYSPDNTQIATGGHTYRSAANIWDAKTGKLIATLEHDRVVFSLAWTSEGKKLITASYGPIRIFDTATWCQIATLDGHERYIHAITLSHNNRLLASASVDKTVRLWNLDTNFPVGPPLQHKDVVYDAAFSANGQALVTGCRDENAYVWDVDAILKQVSLQRDQLSTGTNIASQGEPGIQRTPRSSLSDMSFLQVDATRCHDRSGGVDELPHGFFDGMEVNDDSSPRGGLAHPQSSASALIARLASFIHRFRPDNADANEPSQPPRLSGLDPRVLFARLSSLIHRSPAENDAPNELQQPTTETDAPNELQQPTTANDAPNELQQLSTPSRFHLRALLASISSHFPRSQLSTEETESHTVTPSRSRPNTLIGLLSSRFRSQHRTNEEIELSQDATRLHVVDVAPMRDRDVLFVAPREQADRPRHQSAGTATPGARRVHSRPIRLLGHIGLYLCCVCDHQHADGHTQPTQQPQGQSQGQVQASSQTQPATPSASAMSGALVTHATVPGASA